MGYNANYAIQSDFGSLGISEDVELRLSVYLQIPAKMVMEIPLYESGHHSINSIKYYGSRKYRPHPEL